jgi:hypothetical protein
MATARHAVAKTICFFVFFGKAANSRKAIEAARDSSHSSRRALVIPGRTPHINHIAGIAFVGAGG